MQVDTILLEKVCHYYYIMGDTTAVCTYIRKSDPTHASVLVIMLISPFQSVTKLLSIHIQELRSFSNLLKMYMS